MKSQTSRCNLKNSGGIYGCTPHLQHTIAKQQFIYGTGRSSTLIYPYLLRDYGTTPTPKLQDLLERCHVMLKSGSPQSSLHTTKAR